MESSRELTRLLGRLGEGDRKAFEDLLPLVYEELHGIASTHLRRERPGHTLQPTALVHEAYLRLAAKDPPRWSDRAHFYRTAAKVMRAILINHARDRRRIKRDGASVPLPLDDVAAVYEERAVDLLALEEALDRLGEIDSRQAQVVELRFFAGLSIEDAAEVLGVAPRTVDSDWKLARGWLLRELSRD